MDDLARRGARSISDHGIDDVGLSIGRLDVRSESARAAYFQNIGLPPSSCADLGLYSIRGATSRGSADFLFDS